MWILNQIDEIMVIYMYYKIKRLYTESLNTSFFPEFLQNNQVELLVNFNKNIIPIDEKIFSLKMVYSATTNKAPIYLNWLGVCILEFEEECEEEIDLDKLLNNPRIKEFLNEVVNKLSFFVGGNLPKVYDLKGDKEK